MARADYQVRYDMVITTEFMIGWAAGSLLGGLIAMALVEWHFNKGGRGKEMDGGR